MDFRPGGTWHYCMTGPGGAQAWGKATYREIVAPERIVFLDTFSNSAGEDAPGMPAMNTTVEFAEQDGNTNVTSRTEFGSPDELKSVLDMGVVEGLSETWDRLEEYLTKSN